MSGSDIPYHLRVNKYIERQLFVEALAHIDRAFPLRDYAYISMGGAYLEDFRLVHQAFGIQRLYSFDLDEAVVDRQKVNAPFGFIRCEPATSGEVIQRMDDLLSELQAQNAIVWLDYTIPKDRRAQLLELRTLIPKLGIGDVVKVTLNANPGSLGDQKDHATLVARAQALDSGTPPPFATMFRASPEGPTRPPPFHEWRLAALQKNLGDFCPPNLTDAKACTGHEGLASVLAEAVRIAAVGGIEPRSSTHCLDLVCAVRYSDGQQMLTVTMIIVDRSDEDFLSRTRLDSWPLRSSSWANVHELKVPYLSLRERYRIHLAMDQPPQASHDTLGFLLDPDDESSLRCLEQYRIHYLRYPTFVPADL